MREQLDAEDEIVAVRAAHGLGRCGAEGVEPLIHALETARSEAICRGPTEVLTGPGLCRILTRHAALTGGRSA